MRALVLGAVLAVGLSGAASAQMVGGRYQVQGTNPNGTHYGGTAEIMPHGNVCRIAWHVGTEWRGICMLSGDTFAASYQSGQTSGLLIYKLGQDGTLSGVWTVGANETGTADAGPDAMTDRRTQKERMLAGALYLADDPELAAERDRAAAWLARYNAVPVLPPGERQAMLAEGLGAVGAGVFVRPPFFCDYGYNIAIGDGAFLNFNCVVLDVVQVTIGSNAQIGSAVQILTADHPRDPALRAQRLELGRPVAIGSNVWIGSGAVILPGVAIGDNAVIGAGSVVTRDVPAGATAFGNPARVRA